MKIGGVQWFSLLDYPGEMSVVLATIGCNMRCKYCHNPFLFDATPPAEYQEENILAELKKRRKLATAVVITGGEPTLQPDLIPFMKKIKALGYKVKLDSNGTRPEILQQVLDANCADYIAMDVKAPLEKYQSITQVPLNTDNIMKSITLIKQSGVQHEFRTTVYPELTQEDFEKIRDLVKGADNYYIQQFNPETSYQAKQVKPYTVEKLHKFKEITSPEVPTQVRA